MSSPEPSPTATVARSVTEAEFATAVLEASRLRGVVVDFWAPWCGPCHQLAPVLEAVAARHAGEVDLVKVDVDEAPGLARRYKVQGIPAVKAFRDGAVVAELTGVQPEAAIDRLFAAVRPSESDWLVSQAGQAPAEGRERLLREALEHEPGHRAAITALARLLGERGETEEARALLDRVPLTDEVARLRAELNLAGAVRDPGTVERLRAAADAGDAEAALELGRALASEGVFEEALELLLAAAASPATRERARSATLEVFQLLGNDSPLVRAARPRLASALFS